MIAFAYNLSCIELRLLQAIKAFQLFKGSIVSELAANLRVDSQHGFSMQGKPKCWKDTRSLWRRPYALELGICDKASQSTALPIAFRFCSRYLPWVHVSLAVSAELNRISYFQQSEQLLAAKQYAVTLIFHPLR